jgi:hypothetical protein
MNPIKTPSILIKSDPVADKANTDRKEAIRADHSQWIRHPRTIQFAQSIKTQFEREIELTLQYAMQPENTADVLIHARNAANYSKTLATLTQAPE